MDSVVGPVDGDEPLAEIAQRGLGRSANVLFVVLDDTGFAHLGCYGSPIQTPNFDRLAGDGVRFVGVNTRDYNTTDALRFEDEFGITYPSVVDTDGRRLLAFRDTLPPNAIPTTLVIDRAGNLAARVLGEVTETTLRELVGDVLAEDPGAG